jgi:hypothetical protein
MQHSASAGVQPIEDDLPQVFDDVTIGSREVIDQGLRIRVALQCHRGEFESGRPALGLFGQLRATGSRERMGHPCFAETLDLAVVERKLLLSQFQQPAAQAQLAEPQARCFAATQHELDGGRGEFDEPFHDAVRVFRRDHVQVSKQHERTVVLREVDGERFQRRRRARPPRFQLRRRIIAQADRPFSRRPGSAEAASARCPARRGSTRRGANAASSRTSAPSAWTSRSRQAPRR